MRQPPKIAVILERRGFDDHTYKIADSFASFGLWSILEGPAMAFIQRMKREHPRLAFQAKIKVVESYVNDGFVPELELEMLFSNEPDLAKTLLEQFIKEHEHLVTGEK